MNYTPALDSSRKIQLRASSTSAAFKTGNSQCISTSYNYTDIETEYTSLLSIDINNSQNIGKTLYASII